MKISQFSYDDSRWDKFCLKSDDCWFWHTSEWMKYTVEYTGKESEILSFFIEDGNKDILAIFPLIREGKILAYSGSYGPNPALRNGLSISTSKSLLRELFNHIDLIAKNYDIEKCMISLSSLAKNNLNEFAYNYLMKYNYENESLNTQILDLQKDKEVLWGEIKKSHRNEIKKGKSLFKFVIDFPCSSNDSEFKKFKNLHFLAAGQKTRSDKTWDFQYEWKTKGNAIIILAYKGDEPIGGIYTLLYKDGAYYGVSANHPDYESLPVSHSIQWKMIKWLKENRYKFYDLGFQYFSNQPYNHPTQKEIDISTFKRHFGGFTITHFRGTKKYKSN